MPTAESRAKSNANLVTFKKGQSGNPKGRKKGQRDYITIYKEALRKIGEAKDMTPEEVEDLLHQVGLEKALKGDPKFHSDVLDRLHGKATQKQEITGEDGGPINTSLTVTFKDADNDDS